MEHLKQTLGVSVGYEYKFNKMSHRFREAFFTAVHACSWEAGALVVDKAKLSDPWRKIDKLTFYVKFMGELVARMPVDTWQGRRLVLDRFGRERETVRRLRQEIRLRGVKTVRHLVVKRSDGEPLLQLADMIAGAVYRRYAAGEWHYYEMISRKVRVWEHRD